MFDHSADKILPIRLNSDGVEGKDGKADEAIDDTLCDVDIYCKEGKLTKAIGHCTNSGGGGVNKVAAAGLSSVR